MNLKSALLFLVVCCVLANATNALSVEQEQWLKLHNNTLIVGLEEDYYPFIFSENGNAQGLSANYLAKFSKDLGVKVEFTQPSALPDLMNQAEADTLDMITSLTYTTKRAKLLVFTDPYLEVPAGVFSSKKRPITLDYANENKLRVAVGEAYAAETYLRETYPDLVIIPVKNDFVALSAVKDSSADLAVVDTGSATYLLRKNKLEGVYYIGDSGFVYHLAFAFTKEDESMATLFNEQIKKLSKDDVKMLNGDYLSPPLLPFYVSQWFFLVVSVVVLLIAFLGYLWGLSKRNT